MWFRKPLFWDAIRVKLKYTATLKKKDGRNPAPVDKDDKERIPLFTGVYTSLVVQDFFHEQHDIF